MVVVFNRRTICSQWTQLKIMLFGMLTFLLATSIATAQVISYTAPKTQILSTDYTVEVNGKPVPVYPVASQHRDEKIFYGLF